MRGPCPEAEESRLFQANEMVQVSSQKINEVVEISVAVAVTDASPGFLGNVPG